MSGHHRVPVSGGQQGGNHPNGGGLAGPVGADEGKDLALAHVKTDALDRLYLAVPLSQLAHF